MTPYETWKLRLDAVRDIVMIGSALTVVWAVTNL